MSVWSQTTAERRRARFWRTAPPDPTQQAKQRGTPYHARRSITQDGDRVLMPSDMMPLGPHAGKHLHAVPPDYLLWVDQQPWSKAWHHWKPIASYIERFITCDAETSQAIHIPTGPLIYVEPIQRHPTSIACFQAGSSHLHTLPDYLDYLQTFALGALWLQPQWFQHKECPHYDLTIAKHQQAIRLGAVEISRRQMGEHLQLWREFRNNKRQTAPDPTTHTPIKNRKL